MISPCRARDLAIGHRAAFAALALLAAAPLAGQSAPLVSRDTASVPALGDSLPLDPAVATGVLPNGLRYYVRANREPRARAELRLAVRAGSVLEDSTQRGLAHLVEHMAFSGTTTFPRQRLVRYLESLGMRFGPDLNASTGFDETIYQLTIPTDSAGVLERALQILDDWARGIAFDSAQVARERGVVLEEWRLRRGAGARVQDALLPVVFRGSRYAERIPIGDTATVAHATPAALRRFYARWYRPDLMAVIVVGDVNRDSVVRLVRARFARLPRPATPAVLPIFPVPPPDSVRVAVATDAELTASGVSVMTIQTVEPQGTVRDFRRELTEGLADAMLNERLAAIAQRPDAPFLGAGSGEGRLVRSAATYTLGASVRDGAIATGLAALLTEGRRAARGGFTATELDRARRVLLRGYEQAAAERGKIESGALADAYVEHFLLGTPAPSVDDEDRLARQLAPGITLDEVNRVASSRLDDSGRVVLAAAPAKAGLTPPTPDALRALFDSVARMPVVAYVDSAATGALVERPPAPAAIVSDRALPAVGAREWRLANGVRVVVKPTDFANDQVLVSGWAPGGLSLAPDSLLVPARSAPSAVGAMGLGRFSAVQLRKRLAGKAASAWPYIGEIAQEVEGSGSAKDLPTLFQLIYLTMTAPRADSAAFAAYRERVRASLADRSASPEAAFSDTLVALLTQHAPRRRPLTPAYADRLDLDRSLAFYRARFANGGAFTFYIVGNVVPDSLRPLVERWLGGLPSTGRSERWVDRGERYPTGVERATVRRGREPKALTEIVFSGPIGYTPDSVFGVRALASLLDLRLRETLRQALGGTYSVDVGAQTARYPTSTYALTIGFGAAPARLDSLVRVVFREIAALQRAGPTATELATVRRTLLRARQVGERENGFWLDAMVETEMDGWPLSTIAAFPRFVRALDRAALAAAARGYLDTTRYVRVSLVPDSTAAVPAPPPTAPPAAAPAPAGAGGGARERMGVPPASEAKTRLPAARPTRHPSVPGSAPRVAKTRATAWPILLFGVLAPAVIPTRTGPGAASHPAVSTSACAPGGRWRTVPRSASMHDASST